VRNSGHGVKSKSNRTCRLLGRAGFIGPENISLASSLINLILCRSFLSAAT